MYEISELEDFAKLAINFDCGNYVLNYYLINDALYDKTHTTYVFLDEDSMSIIGYISFQCSGMLNVIMEKPDWRITEPAIQINFFALDLAFQHLRFSPEKSHSYLSDSLLQHMIARLIDIAHNVIAAEYIIVYSLPAAEKFYRRNGFQPYTHYIGDNVKINKSTQALADEWSFIDECVPMFLAID